MRFHYAFVLRRGLFLPLLDEVTAHSSSLSSEFSEQSQPEHEHRDDDERLFLRRDFFFEELVFDDDLHNNVICFFAFVLLFRSLGVLLQVRRLQLE